MTYVSPFASALLVCAVTWLVWTLVRRTRSNSLSNIPGPPPASFWTGHIPALFSRHGWEFNKKLAQEYGPVVKLGGMFGSTFLYVYDAKALHSIMLQDQLSYQEQSEFIALNTLIFGQGVLSTEDRMRSILPIFYDVVGKLRDAIRVRVERDGPHEIDMLKWMGRAALELIGQGGLGYSFDPFTRDSQDPYAVALKAYIPALMDLGVLRTSLPYVYKLGPASIRRRILDLIPHKGLQKLKTIVDTMDGTANAIYRAKKTAFERGDEAVMRQVGEGRDIMSVLMEANMEAAEEDRLPESELVAQMSTLLFAGTDTTSSTLARILQLLALHPDVQIRLRREIMTARAADEDLSYDKLMQLPLLDAVCRESLRMYPMISLMSREAVKDVILPLSEPIRGLNGDLISEVAVPCGTTVILGTLGWNRDKAVWGDDASEWKPERWLSPLPSAVSEARVPSVYSHTITFLGGQRSCIGVKFAELEMTKVVLAGLPPSFVFGVEKPIYWNMAGIRYSTSSKESELPELPLQVSLYSDL
ncbi:cytochrome P450 monooxygenase [Amylocystis lapponica]|nr:cytochrome P450 monooxygenase [Amylocystis lapponica]